MRTSKDIFFKESFISLRKCVLKGLAEEGLPLSVIVSVVVHTVFFHPRDFSEISRVLPPGVELFSL